MTVSRGTRCCKRLAICRWHEQAIRIVVWRIDTDIANRIPFRVSTTKFYMNIEEQIKEYITSQPEPKRSDMQALHGIILQVMPACKLWFLDGKDSENKTVSNPNIGYGFHTIKYADGKTREFYQIGISANTTGI